MKIQEILEGKGREVVTIEEDRTVLEAVRRLVERGIGALVVVREGAPVGILSERDVLHLTAHAADGLGDLVVGACMTRDLVTTAPGSDLHDMMGVMTRKRIRHLPVVEADALVGIVSIGDLLKAAQELAERENNHLRRYIQGTA